MLQRPHYAFPIFWKTGCVMTNPSNCEWICFPHALISAAWSLHTILMVICKMATCYFCGAETTQMEEVQKLFDNYTANILTVLSTAFGIVMFPTVIWLCMLLPKAVIDIKLHSSTSLSVMGAAV